MTARGALDTLVEAVGRSPAAQWSAISPALEAARVELLAGASECGCAEKLRDQARRARERARAGDASISESLHLFAALLDGIAAGLPAHQPETPPTADSATRPARSGTG